MSLGSLAQIWAASQLGFSADFGVSGGSCYHPPTTPAPSALPRQPQAHATAGLLFPVSPALPLPWQRYGLASTIAAHVGETVNMGVAC